MDSGRKSEVQWLEAVSMVQEEPWLELVDGSEDERTGEVKDTQDVEYP